jgi:hypothetical protein
METNTIAVAPRREYSVSLNRTESQPFAKPEVGRIAVMVINIYEGDHQGLRGPTRWD